MTATTLPGVLLSGTHAGRPAASAVAGGTLYAETDTGQIYQSNGVSTWSAWGAAAGGGVTQEDYAQITTITSITGGSGAPTSVLSGAGFTASGTDTYLIEFYTPYYRSLANGLLFVDLYEGSTQLGHLALMGGGSHGDMYYPGATSLYKHTPAAGTRTYNIKAFQSGANGEVGAGAGGNDYLPAFIRVLKGA
jgi:hypothetical protein